MVRGQDRLLSREAQAWDSARICNGELYLEGKPYRSWAHDPVVTEWNNANLTGDPERSWLDLLGETLGDRRHGISLGAGTGWLEEEILRRKLADRIVCLDLFRGSSDAVGLEFRVADLNVVLLPPELFDFVLVHHSLHHVERVEHVIHQAEQCLRPGGLLILHDYVGENREMWTSRKLARLEAIRNDLDLPRGLGAPPMEIPPEVTSRRSPFEQVNSMRILPTLAQLFRPIRFRSWGGILHPLRRHIWDQDFRRRRCSLQQLLEWDELAVREGLLPCFAFGVFSRCIDETPLPQQGDWAELQRVVSLTEEAEREPAAWRRRWRVWGRFLVWKLARSLQV